MRSWNLKEAKPALEWASTPEEQRPPIEVLARQIGRTPKAVENFLRRQLPPGQRPWVEKPRWRTDEAAAVAAGSSGTGAPFQRSPEAVRKYKRRNLSKDTDDLESEDLKYTITELSQALGVSRPTVYRLLARGYLRRWKGGVAESSFVRLVKEHPEVIPYARLSRDQREWLVIHGFPDPTLKVKPPSTKGLFPKDSEHKRVAGGNGNRASA
jgi:excisionase family DNA binding protein